MKNLKKSFLTFFKNNWIVGLLIFTILAFFWKTFLKGQIPFPGDFVLGIYYPWLDYKWGYGAGVPVKNPIMADVPSFIWPMLTLGIKMIKEGQLPLWNPYILAGNPLLANFQSAPFSVTNIFYFLVPTVDAWSLQIITQHIFAALFTYILLRHWKVSKWGAFLGGFIYAFSGFNLIWSQWNGHTLSAAFIPLILYFEDKLINERKIKFGIFLSICLAIQLYSGYPQVVLYTAIAMALLWLIRLSKNLKSNFRVYLAGTVLVFIFGLIGIGLAAPQWLPGAELLGSSQRAIEYHPFEWAFLPWIKSITFIAPDFFGNHAARNFWGPQDYTSNTGVVGVVAVVLLILSVGLVKKNRENLYSFILVIVALVLAFPTPVSIFLWRSGILGLNAASAHRSLVLFTLGISVLAAMGFDFLNKNISKKLKITAIMVPLITIIGFGLYAYTVRARTTYGVSVFPIAIRNLVLPSIVLLATGFIVLIKPKLKLLVIMFCIVELFYFGWKFTPFFDRTLIFPSTPLLDFLVSKDKPYRVTGNRVIPMNMRMVYGLESPEGYDAVYPERTSRLLFAINDSKYFEGSSGRYGFIDREDSKVLDLMNTKYFVALKLDEMGNPSPDGTKLLPTYKNPKFKKVFEDRSTVVLENKNVLPRAFMVYDWQVIEGDNQELEALVDSNMDLSRKIILDKKPDIEISNDNLTSKSIVNYKKYKEDESVLSVDTNKAGMLFVSDTYYPGWRATVDGKPVDIFRADYNFRAIEIPEGVHTVDFIYRPDSFYNGLKVAAASGLVIVFVIGYTLIIRIKNEKH